MSDDSFQRLSAAQARQWLQEHPDALRLDARQKGDHAANHLPGSVHLNGRIHETLLRHEAKTRPVFIYCYHGHASQTYASMFKDFGFRDVADLVGGHEAWLRDLPSELDSWLGAEGYADATSCGPHGNTPLMHAAWKGRADIVHALLDLGVDLDAVNGDGNNALWLACVADDAALVTTLVQAGVDIDHENATGATSLMYAASSGKAGILATLLALGADPQRRTQDDFTALDMAATLPCLRLLRDATRCHARPHVGLNVIAP